MIRIETSADGSCLLHTMGILYTLGLQHRLNHNPNQPFPEDSLTALLRAEYLRTMPDRSFDEDHDWIVNAIIVNQGLPTSTIAESSYYWHFVSTLARVFNEHPRRSQLSELCNCQENKAAFNEHLSVIEAQGKFGVPRYYWDKDADGKDVQRERFLPYEDLHIMARMLQLEGFELTRPDIQEGYTQNLDGSYSCPLADQIRDSIITGNPDFVLNDSITIVHAMGGTHWEMKIAPSAYLECIRSKLQNRDVPAYVRNIQRSQEPAEYLLELITRVIKDLENQDSSLMAYIPAVARRKREILLKFHQQKLPVIKAQIDEYLSKLDQKNTQRLEDILTKLAVLNESETERLKNHGIGAVSSEFLSNIVDTIIDILLYLFNDDPNHITTDTEAMLNQHSMFSENTKGPVPPAIACH